jgi:hypothetical protein
MKQSPRSMCLVLIFRFKQIPVLIRLDYALSAVPPLPTRTDKDEVDNRYDKDDAEDRT